MEMKEGGTSGSGSDSESYYIGDGGSISENKKNFKEDLELERQKEEEIPPEKDSSYPNKELLPDNDSKGEEDSLGLDLAERNYRKDPEEQFDGLKLYFSKHSGRVVKLSSEVRGVDGRFKKKPPEGISDGNSRNKCSSSSGGSSGGGDGGECADREKPTFSKSCSSPKIG